MIFHRLVESRRLLDHRECAHIIPLWDGVAVRVSMTEEDFEGRLSADMLQQFLEFFDGQSRVLDNSAHCESVDRIVARDNDDTVIFCH